MAISHLLLIILSVTLSAFAQIVLKRGMSDAALQERLAGGSPLEVAIGLILSPYVVGGLSIYFLGAVFWLFVLSRVDVSQAYPFVGLGFVLTMLFSIVLLGENVTLMRAAGTLVIVAGVLMVGRS